MTTLAYIPTGLIEWAIIGAIAVGGWIAKWSANRKKEIARQEGEGRMRAGLDPRTGDLPTVREEPPITLSDDDLAPSAGPMGAGSQPPRGLTLEELRQRALAKIAAERRAAGMSPQAPRRAPIPQMPSTPNQAARTAATKAATRAGQIEQLRQRQAALANQQRRQQQEARARSQRQPQPAARPQQARAPQQPRPQRVANEPVLIPVEESTSQHPAASPHTLGSMAQPTEPRKRAMVLGLVAGDPNVLRRAFIYSEIFGKPVGDR